MGDEKKVNGNLSEIIPIAARLTDNKLNGSNKLRSMGKASHLTSEPLNDDTRDLWLQNDARLFLQIMNSIESSVISLVNHCEYVKELMDYLDFLYSGEKNISRIFSVCKAFHCGEQQDRSLTAYVMEFKKIYEEFNSLLPLSTDVKTMQTQREQIAVMSFLTGLRPEHDSIKSHRGGFKSFGRTRGGYQGSYRGNLRGGHTDKATELRVPSSDVECHYCHELGHTKRACKKFLAQNLKNSSAHVASSSTFTISADEYAEYGRLKESVKPDATGTAAFAETGNSSTCLLSSASKWVIDSGASDHMTGNHHLFSNFNTQSSYVTIANGTTSPVLGSGTIKLTPSDLSTKQIIGRGRVSDGLYILETTTKIPRSLVCSKSSPLVMHCQLGHPSLQSLKKLCPEFSSVSSLYCESCQFAKHQRVHLSPRVNKRVASPFELVHSGVWGPCPVTSKTGFKYFVTFIDDYSRVTWLYLMKNRSEVFTHFCSFVAEVKTQFQTSVQTLRRDNAKEFLSESFTSYMLQHGILHESSCVDTPAQNGVAERKNRHLLEVARALLFQMNVPKPFLG
ncbi:uncharacterized protein [Rutidosis leptorrhynchoides]|uniref:uncharacterized protein n=1 Tax=Rutidosis leptorrhynchoides TaxID=125765 RepID=UPI003A98DC47